MAINSKTTIKIIVDSDVKIRVQKIAKAHGVSLSYLVGEFLKQIVNKPENQKDLLTLVGEVTTENTPKMVDWGKPVGKEIW